VVIVKSVLGCVKGVLSSSLLHRQRIVGSAAATKARRRRWRSLHGGSMLACTVVAAAGPQPPPQTLDAELTKPRPGVTVGLRSWRCVREKIEVEDVTRRDLASTAGC
jgi:hypothetical protein